MRALLKITPTQTTLAFPPLSTSKGTKNGKKGGGVQSKLAFPPVKQPTQQDRLRDIVMGILREDNFL